MSETFLDQIVVKTRAKFDLAKTADHLKAVRSRAEQVRRDAEPHRLRAVLSQKERTNIIAEIKRSSPSKGVINDTIDVSEVARSYETGGAAAISVLTENEFFGGSLADLELVSETVSLPVLQKDFIVDVYQIYEAAAAGADAVLLIVAALSEEELRLLFRTAERDLGLDALVEVHSVEEMRTAENIGARIIGVNNRDLHSLGVSLDVSRRLINERPETSLMVAESGISTRAEIEEFQDLGFNGFLIGETLMRADDIIIELVSLTGRATEAI